jgi:hypothetical protein
MSDNTATGTVNADESSQNKQDAANADNTGNSTSNTNRRRVAGPKSDTDLFHAIANHPQFTLSWENRRKVVRWTLIFTAVMFTLITGAICYDTVEHIDITANVSELLFSLILSTSVFATAVIGSYVFGAAWDISGLRNTLSNLAEKFIVK